MTFKDKWKVTHLYDSAGTRDFILGICNCGCSQTIPIRNTQGKLARFIHGHNGKLKDHSISGHKYSLGDCSGPNNHKWKGGISKDTKGYIQILKPNHPFADSRGYTRQHRLVWEQHNNAILLPWADVHHINGDIVDNRIGNLQAMMHGDHTKLTWSTIR